MSEFEQRIEFIPAYDKRDEGYGLHNMTVRFCLIGPLGAVQFVIGTNWHLPSAREHLRTFPHVTSETLMHPEGYDVGYHSPKPMYEGQDDMQTCDVLEGDCYYDGSSLLAGSWEDDFVAGGTEWLWPKLEKFYRETFEGDDA